MKEMFNTVRGLLISIPLAATWVCMYILLMLGWGVEYGDKFMKHWNNMLEDTSQDDAVVG